MGIDLSQTMIEYARAQARVQALDNATFEVMDITHPLDFADRSIDLINARLLGFLPPNAWLPLVQEYVRISRPGGLIRLTETELSVSNSPALEQEHSWFFRSLWQAGQSFSPNGEHLTITAQLAPLLRRAGYRHVQVRAYALDWSQGAEAHTAMCRDVMIWFKLMEPFYLSLQIATQEELDRTYEQMLAQMQQDNFAAVHYLLTASGEKPS
jgi:SAM-dependent methyltransferase